MVAVFTSERAKSRHAPQTRRAARATQHGRKEVSQAVIPFTREELITQLDATSHMRNRQKAVMRADMLLIEFIHDEGITAAYQKIQKWGV